MQWGLTLTNRNSAYQRIASRKGCVFEMYEKLIELANKAKKESARAMELESSAKRNEYNAVKEFLNMNGIETGKTVIRIKKSGKEGVLYIRQHIDGGWSIPCALVTRIAFYPLKKNGEVSINQSFDFPYICMESYRYNREKNEYIVDGKVRSEAEMMFLHIQAFLEKIEITDRIAII
jgi:hypothetical protein